jgi:hypothetical protein
MAEHTIELRLVINDSDAFTVVAEPLQDILRAIVNGAGQYVDQLSFTLDGEEQATTETMTTIRAWADGQVVRRYPSG